jgi:hypothetical protein
MKTPREILLERQLAVAPKLDVIRNKVVWEGRRASVPKFRVADTATLPATIWRELILPSRRIWAGLAAIWILIAAANVSMRSASPIAAAKSSPTPEVISTFRQQERILADLIGQNEPRQADPPKPFLPRPSSERRFETFTT